MVKIQQAASPQQGLGRPRSKKVKKKMLNKWMGLLQMKKTQQEKERRKCY